MQRRYWTFVSPLIPFLNLRRVFIVSSSGSPLRLHHDVLYVSEPWKESRLPKACPRVTSGKQLARIEKMRRRKCYGGA